MNRVKKRDIELLVDTLVRTSSSSNPYGKFNDVLKIILKTEDVRLYRNTLLLWLDTMGVLSVDFKNFKYVLNKPYWAKNAIKNQYIISGALNTTEIEILKSNNFVQEKKNEIFYNRVIFELPSTYYTEDITHVRNLGFDVQSNPLFLNIDNDFNVNSVTENLIQGKLNVSEIGEINRVSFIKDDLESKVFIERQDEVYLFNWRTRNYISGRIDISTELNDDEGVKLIKCIKKKDSEGKHSETFVLILSKSKSDSRWNYIYFDSEKIDVRWARFVFLNELKWYDTQLDLTKIKNEDVQSLMGNIIGLKNGGPLLKNPDSSIEDNHQFEIPAVMLKQFIQYDKRKGLLAIPVTVPFPKTFMKYLFNCSGNLPTRFTNNFTLNPNYNIKLLMSGKLSEGGVNVSYPDQNYYFQEDMYLFSCVPSELADKIFEKLNLNEFKRTFFENN